jgi:serine/threonine-protein kinase HipA
LLPGSGFNGYHTTTINGKGEPALSDIIAVALEVGITKQRASQILEEVSEKCIQARMSKVIIKVT